MVPSDPKTNPPIPSSTQPLALGPHPAATAQVTNSTKGETHGAKTGEKTPYEQTQQRQREPRQHDTTAAHTPAMCSTHSSRHPLQREGRGKNKTHTDVFFFQEGPEESRPATGTDNSPSPARQAGRFPARLGMSFWGRFQAFPPGVPLHIKEWMASSAVPGQGWSGMAEANGLGWGKFTGLLSLPRDAEHPVMVGYSLGRPKQVATGLCHPQPRMEGDCQHIGYKL